MVWVKKAAGDSEDKSWWTYVEDYNQDKQVCVRTLTPNGGLLELKELIPHKPHHETRFTNCRVPKQN